MLLYSLSHEKHNLRGNFPDLPEDTARVPGPSYKCLVLTRRKTLPFLELGLKESPFYTGLKLGPTKLDYSN